MGQDKVEFVFFNVLLVTQTWSTRILTHFHCYYGHEVRKIQKQPLRGVIRKKCSEDMQQIYRRTPMPKCNFNKGAKQLYWRTPFTKNISGRLLLKILIRIILYILIFFKNKDLPVSFMIRFVLIICPVLCDIWCLAMWL